ncbi:MAG: hypothetical protein JOZ51_04355 [Chloroflexi bacterium]|nr:hypothetical protein [Chloroflexota bacterium]
MNFDPKSRYAKAPATTVTDARGRTVAAVLPPDAPAQLLLGYHVRRQGEHLDHLAARYLENPHGYWRIAEINDAMFAEQISEAIEIAIPAKGS